MLHANKVTQLNATYTLPPIISCMHVLLTLSWYYAAWKWVCGCILYMYCCGWTTSSSCFCTGYISL